jgi:hypothetical protein
MGMASGCQPNVCFEPKVPEPIAIPPGNSVACVCKFEVTGTGYFEFPMVLFLADGDNRMVETTLYGVGVAVESRDNARDK